MSCFHLSQWPNSLEPACEAFAVVTIGSLPKSTWQVAEVQYKKQVGGLPAEQQPQVGKHIGNAEPSFAVLVVVAAVDAAVLVDVVDVAEPAAADAHEVADVAERLEALHHLIHS